VESVSAEGATVFTSTVIGASTGTPVVVAVDVCVSFTDFECTSAELS
jgi:hypothetical protein